MPILHLHSVKHLIIVKDYVAIDILNHFRFEFMTTGVMLSQYAVLSYQYCIDP